MSEDDDRAARAAARRGHARWLKALHPRAYGLLRREYTEDDIGAMLYYHGRWVVECDRRAAAAVEPGPRAEAMSCPDENHVDNGGTTCAICSDVLPRVRAAIAVRLRGTDGKTCLHRFTRGPLQGQACGARDGRRGAHVAGDRCGRHRARKRKRRAKEKSRWQQLEVD